MSKFIYPWQESSWTHCQQWFRQNRLPHALLLTGMAGMGKQHFMQIMAQRLLCENAHDKEYACDVCRSCHLFKLGHHPDFFCVTVEEKSKSIKVDQIRILTQTLANTPQLANKQIVAIFPAEAMNSAAANALLKTLEEPSGDVVLLLLSNEPGRLLPTIKSRCQRLNFSTTQENIAIIWLQQQGMQQDAKILLTLADGAPLKALALAKQNVIHIRDALLKLFILMQQPAYDALASVEAMLKNDLNTLLQVWSGLINDLIRMQLQVQAGYLTNRDKLSELNRLNSQLSLTRLQSHWLLLQEARQQMGSHIHVNAQMLLEKLLLSLK